MAKSGEREGRKDKKNYLHINKLLVSMLVWLSPALGHLSPLHPLVKLYFPV